MKKLYSSLVALTLCLLMVGTAFAAGSPSAESSAPADVVEIPVANANVTVLDSAVKEGVYNVVTNDTHLTNLGVNTKAELVSSFDLKYEGEVPAGGVKIPVKVETAQAGDYVYILHRQDSVEGKPWEVVGQGYLGADLTINATFKNFSPVAVLVVDSADAAAAGIKAPKTGQE